MEPDPPHLDGHVLTRHLPGRSRKSAQRLYHKSRERGNGDWLRPSSDGACPHFHAAPPEKGDRHLEDSEPVPLFQLRSTSGTDPQRLAESRARSCSSCARPSIIPSRNALRGPRIQQSHPRRRILARRSRRSRTWVEQKAASWCARSLPASHGCNSPSSSKLICKPTPALQDQFTTL